MNEEPKPKNKSNTTKELVLLFAIPAAIIVFAALAAYIPRLLAHPQFDFVYTACSGYYQCTDPLETAVIIGDKSMTSDREPVAQPAEIYYYNVSTNSSRPLTITEFNNLKLDKSTKSPDGYTLSRDSASSGFLFWSSGNQDQWFLSSGLAKQPVDVVSDHQEYSNLKFIGWIEK